MAATQRLPSDRVTCGREEIGHGRQEEAEASQVVRRGLPAIALLWASLLVCGCQLGLSEKPDFNLAEPLPPAATEPARESSQASAAPTDVPPIQLQPLGSEHAVKPVSFQEELPLAPPEQLPATQLPAPRFPATEGPADGTPSQRKNQEADTALYLPQVIDSLQRSYPALQSIMAEQQIADGKQLAAWGDFDLHAKGHSISTPEGFYETYRNVVSVEQPMFHGGYVYGKYKLGRGNFEPWYGERESDDGGEFSVGFGSPLLKGRVIDERRAELFKAELARQAVNPAIQAELLEFARQAAIAYWSWVAAGQALEAQRELLSNAEARVEQIRQRVDAGDLKRLTRINNEQLIASRETKVIQSVRKLQQSAIKLSLFYRDETGRPIVPHESQLPSDFPRLPNLKIEDIGADVETALRSSPHLAQLGLLAEQVQVELGYSENMLLPKLDLKMLASKDVGEPASSKRDKTPFIFEAGLYAEVPLQRREARGKIFAAQGKLAQLNAKRQFLTDKIAAAVLDSVSAIRAAEERIERSEINLRLARESLELSRLQFDAGDMTLVDLNIFEKSVTEAELLLIDSQAAYWSSIADYQAALARIAGEQPVQEAP